MSQEERNVVILGKVGAGKRTLGNAIFGTDIFREDRGVLGTRKAESYFGEHTNGNIHYRVLAVDTESVQTGYNDPVPHIKRNNLEHVNIIIFVIAHGRYTDESHASLQCAVEGLSERAKSMSALIITHCEGIKESERKAIADEFRSNSRSMQIVTCMNLGIYTVGFPDITNIPSYLSQVYSKGINDDTKVINGIVDRCDSTLKSENIWIQGKAQLQFQRSSELPAHTPPSSQDRQQSPAASLIPHQTHQLGTLDRIRLWFNSRECNIF